MSAPLLDGGNAFTVYGYTGLIPSVPSTDPNYAVGRTVYDTLDFSYDPLAKWKVKVEGWDSSAGTTLVVTRKATSHGAFAGPRFKPEKPLVITGSVQVDDPAQLIPAIDRLKAAIAIDERNLSITRFGQTRTASVYRQGLVDVQRYPNPNLATFTCQLVQTDHRKYGDPITVETNLPSVSGGLSFPISFPLSIPATQNSGIVTINNPGYETGKVLLRIYGPAPSPMVTHRSSGLSLTFASSYMLNAGNWLDIDMQNKLALENGQSDRSKFITSRGWFGLDPGDNDFGFQVAGAYNPIAKLVVTGYPAYE